MHDVYEVCIEVAGEEYEPTYGVEHRFPCLPEVETLIALKGEAVDTFEVLFPNDQVENVSVRVLYLSHEEREPPSEEKPRVRR